MTQNTDGEWICPVENCRNVNFSYKTKCNKCHKDRKNIKENKTSKVIAIKSIGKDAAKQSNGLFNENDWECPKCSNINWAKRNYCNQCNAPRYRSAEIRTGLGGGYKENDDVDYIRRNDTNEEFDEYGRRRGKINPKNHSIIDIHSNTNSESKSNDSESYLELKTDDETNSEKDSEYSNHFSNEDESEDEDADLSKYDFGDDDDDYKVSNSKIKRSLNKSNDSIGDYLNKKSKH